MWAELFHQTLNDGSAHTGFGKVSTIMFQSVTKYNVFSGMIGQEELDCYRLGRIRLSRLLFGRGTRRRRLIVTGKKMSERAESAQSHHHKEGINFLNTMAVMRTAATRSAKNNKGRYENRNKSCTLKYFTKCFHDETDTGNKNSVAITFESAQRMRVVLRSDYAVRRSY